VSSNTVNTEISISSKSAHCNRALSTLGAAAGLFLPKCPLCWIAISGFAVTTSATTIIKVLGVTVFAFGFWRSLNRCHIPVPATLTLTTLSTAILSFGMWEPVSLELRLSLWSIVMLWMVFSAVRWRSACCHAK